MKKMIFTMAATLFLSTTICLAQRPRGERPNPEKRIERLIQELGLNPEQAQQFKEVMNEMRPGKPNNGERPSKEEMEKRKEEMKAKRSEMQAKRKEMDEKLKNILTEEQYEKYQNLHKRQGPRKPMRHKKD